MRNKILYITFFLLVLKSFAFSATISQLTNDSSGGYDGYGQSFTMPQNGNLTKFEIRTGFFDSNATVDLKLYSGTQTCDNSAGGNLLYNSPAIAFNHSPGTVVSFVLPSNPVAAATTYSLCLFDTTLGAKFNLAYIAADTYPGGSMITDSGPQAGDAYFRVTYTPSPAGSATAIPLSFSSMVILGILLMGGSLWRLKRA